MSNASHSNEDRGRRRGAFASSALAAAIALAIPLSAMADIRYHATPIAKGTIPSGINANGDVVGSVMTPSGPQAFLWSDGVLRLLGTLGGVNSWAVAVNDRREVAGYSETLLGEKRAFLWRNGAMQDLGALPGHRESVATGVNNSGWVVGMSSTGSPHRAFLHDGQSMMDLGTLGGEYSLALAINDSAQVVGEADRPETRRQAFLWSAGAMHDLGDPLSTFLGNSGASAINRAGHVAGFQNRLSAALPLYFTDMWLYADGQKTFVSCPYFRCLPMGINDADQVVGNGFTKIGASEGAFVWNEVIGGNVISAFGWSIWSASGINAKGQVVALGWDGEGYQGLRLEPLGTVEAVEFFHAAYVHYFVTANADEIRSLDDSVLSGWQRTGQSFGVWYSVAAGLVPVCRFWSGQSYAPKSSHFYTPYADECAKVKADPVWQFEGNAFALRLPQAGLGYVTCPADTRPLYRAYNRGMSGAPNHRYMTDPAVLGEMVAQGWQVEGDLWTRIFACVPHYD